MTNQEFATKMMNKWVEVEDDLLSTGELDIKSALEQWNDQLTGYGMSTEDYLLDDDEIVGISDEDLAEIAKIIDQMIPARIENLKSR